MFTSQGILTLCNYCIESVDNRKGKEMSKVSSL
jgi:hypothetical protein